MTLKEKLKMKSTIKNLIKLTSKINPTPLEIFDLPLNFNKNDLKLKYYDLVRLYHPDSHFNNELSHKQKTKDFQLIVKAYEILSDVNKRQLYSNIGLNDDITDSTNYNVNPYNVNADYVNRYYGTRHSKTNFRSNYYYPPFNEKTGGWDGEHYYSRYHHPLDGHHRPYYSSNKTFLSILIIISLLAYFIEYKTFLPSKQSFEDSHLNANNSLSLAHYYRQKFGLNRLKAARNYSKQQRCIEEINNQQAIQQGNQLNQLRQLGPPGTIDN